MLFSSSTYVPAVLKEVSDSFVYIYTDIYVYAYTLEKLLLS